MDATSIASLGIVWSKHAIERWRERFGEDKQQTAPTGLIQAVGRNKAIDESFRVRVGKAVYVCARREDSILIITCAVRGADYKPRKGKSRRRKP